MGAFSKLRSAIIVSSKPSKKSVRKSKIQLALLFAFCFVLPGVQWKHVGVVLRQPPHVTTCNNEKIRNTSIPAQLFIVPSPLHSWLLSKHSFQLLFSFCALCQIRFSPRQVEKKPFKNVWSRQESRFQAPRTLGNDRQEAHPDCDLVVRNIWVKWGLQKLQNFDTLFYLLQIISRFF